MKKILKFVLILFFTSNLYSQKHIKDAIEICTAFSNFESLAEANQTLKSILDSVGITQNFALYPCDNIPNAAAFTFNGDRYIFYNPDFMKKLGSYTRNISDVFILAHEVGHHVNFHTKDLLLISPDKIQLPRLEEKRKQELEADEFAGFVMARLGYSLGEAKESFKSMKSDWRTEKTNDDKYSTHPVIFKRLGAVNKGYFRLKEGKPAQYLTAMEYWQRANKKGREKDFYGAERDFLASLEILDIGQVRFDLAITQFELKEYDKAINNINLAIQEDNSNPEYYYWRANNKWYLNDKEGACNDWKLAVRIGGDNWASNLNLCN